MPFIAVCPYCQRGKFQVPSKKRGHPETCPRCQQHFLLLPQGESAAASADFYRLPEPMDADPDTDSGEMPVPLADATAVPNLTTALEPSISHTALPSVVIVRHPDPQSTHDGYTAPQLFAFAGGMLFGLGMIATLFPYGRLIAVVFVLIGGLLAGLSLLGLDKPHRWLGRASLGVNVFGALLVVLLPTWVGVSEWVPPPIDEKTGAVTAVSRDGSQTAVPVDRVDASKAVWQQGDVRMQMMSAVVGILDPKAKVKEKCLRITLSITNVGVARAVEFQGWNANPMAVPTLNGAGKPIAMKLAESVASGPVYPGKMAEATLVFAVPPANTELQLELPSLAFGGTDPVRFTIPATMISR